MPGGMLSESIEHIPVSFLSRIDFKYVYPHILYFSRNNAIRIFHVFVFAILRPCVGLYRRIDSRPMLHKSLSAFERARAYNNDESLRNQLQINFESATGSHFLWSDPFFIGYGRNSVGRNSASRVPKKNQEPYLRLWFLSYNTATTISL